MASLFKNPSFSIPIFSLLIIFIFLLPQTHSLSSYPLPKVPSQELDNYPEPPLGRWSLLQRSIGISAMHIQLLHNNHLIIFDRTDFGPSNITLPHNNCPTTYKTTAGVVVPDCTAHSILYDVATNTFRPLTVLSDTFCSSGAVDPTGKLIQTGGWRLGERVVRTFTPCDNDASTTVCSGDWEEFPSSLAAHRWYASNHILPDGRSIVIGGRWTHSYEFFPHYGIPKKRHIRFLAETWDGEKTENNLYPFLHLLPNGNLFIFANNRSIEFNYVRGVVIKEFPIMPLGFRRNYPSTGSSVLLPMLDDRCEVLICGGTVSESCDLAKKKGVYVEATRTCGRMVVTEDNPHWIIEYMPVQRVMGDMVVLPTGDVLIINGAKNGSAGWGLGANPALNPVLYQVSEPDPVRRFLVLSPTTIPRMYHSAVALVADGRVLVSGSNPHAYYEFDPQARYPTELSLEAFYPPYLDPRFATLRPTIVTVETEGMVANYGQMVGVNFELGQYKAENGLAVSLYSPPFTTHSFGMNQRLIFLTAERVDQLSMSTYKVTVRMPVNVNVAPPGYYMLFVVHAGVPSHGVWVQIKR